MSATKTKVLFVTGMGRSGSDQPALSGRLLVLPSAVVAEGYTA